MRTKIILIFLFVLCAASIHTHAQLFKFLTVDIDTNYISDRTKDLTIRALGATKLSTYKFGDYDNDKTLHYKSNNAYSAGLGFVYGFLGLNFTMKLPGINDDDLEYGKTTKFDFQAYAFPRKVALDLYVQYYKGFYADDNTIAPNTLLSKNYIRPDLTTQHIGVNGSYVFNAKQFSFRAAFIQNEYQKKSAGTALLGGGIHYNRISGDSAIIPSDVSYAGFYNNNKFNKIGSFNVGVHGGYAYTLVIKKHFFITGAALIGAGANYSFLRDDANDVFDRNVGFQFSGMYKAAIGYNSEKFYVGLIHINYLNRNSTPIDNAWQQNQTGVVRLVIARRFPFKFSFKKRRG